MENWQRDHIINNLSKLIESINCNDSLLALFRSKKMLTSEDVQVIESKDTGIKKSWCLIDMLLNRTDSYPALVYALYNTSQSGAKDILVTGFISHGSIKFQETVSTIYELLPNLDDEFRKELVCQQQQLSCIDDVVVKNTIPVKLDYYIPRTLAFRGKLDELLFQETCSDIFLFQGIEWNELSRLAAEHPTDVSSDLLDPAEQLQTRFILLESIDHFDIIANKTKQPSHVIQHNDGAYQWIKSQGPVQNIQKYGSKASDIVTEDDFIEHILSKKISVCLTDSPGMGKSVLLANLARSIVDRHPTRLVMFVILREFIPVLQAKAKLTNGLQLNGHLLQTVLSEYCSDHPVGRQIASYKLSNDQSHLCLDGFDEIIPEQREVAKQMLKVITNSFQNCQLFVTARLHMREDLEQTIGTLGFYINPFNLDNQMEFLTKFWRSRGAESESLTDYAEICLTTLAAEMDESYGDIAGIPLQCFMIGEVFLGKAKCYNAETTLGTEVPIRSMAQLYNTLINTKLDTINVEGIRESLIQAHIHSAVTLLFPEDALTCVQYPVDISHEQLCRVGIMEHVADTGSGNVIRFIHRTFAEFFVGLFAFTQLQGVETESVSFVIKKVLATNVDQHHLVDNPFGKQQFKVVSLYLYQRPTIAYFLNSQLQRQTLAFNPDLHLNFSELEIISNISAAVSHGSVELFNVLNTLLDIFESQTNSDCAFPVGLMLPLAAKHSSTQMLQQIFEEIKKCDVGKTELEIEKTSLNGVRVKSWVLYIASFAGNYKIVDYLLRSKHVNLKDAPLVLHFCMWYSSLQSDAVINRKVQIIKFLVQRSSSVLHEKYNSYAPILGKYIHFELLKCALECGAGIHDKDKHLRSLLHIAPEYMTPEMYQNLILFTLNLSGKEILIARDAVECTPLHYAVKFMPILTETLKTFLNQDADINAKDKHGNSILFYALRFQTEKSLDVFIENGAKLDDKNLRLETALHIAYKYLNPSAIDWLSKKGADRTVRDAKGVLPSKAKLPLKLKQAADIQKITFVTNNGKIKIEVDEGDGLSFPSNIMETIYLSNPTKFGELREGNTPLHMEFYKSPIDIEKIKLQFSLNGDFNARNIHGETPLHAGVSIGNISEEVLEFATKVGSANLNIVTKSGFSVLSRAILAKRSLSFLELLVKYGAEVCMVYNILAAVEIADVEYVNFLLTHGADIVKATRENRTGENPLAHTFSLHEEAHFEIAKSLITSKPKLDFDEQAMLQIIHFAITAYETSEKFKTAELFNLMASHGLNFALFCNANKMPIIFVVTSFMSPADCKCFVEHLNRIGLKNLFYIQDSFQWNLLFHCVRKFEVDKDFLFIFSANGVDFNLTDTRQLSVLSHAVICNYSHENLESLTFYGANPNVLDVDGNNLVALSMSCQSREPLEFLFKAAISLHAKNYQGLTPLMNACIWYIANNTSSDKFDFVVRLANLRNLNWNQVHDLYSFLMSQYKSEHELQFVEILKTFKSHQMHPSFSDYGTPVLFSIIQTLGLDNVENFLKLLFDAGYTDLGEIRNKESANLIQYFIQTKNTDFSIKLLPMLGDGNKILNSSDDNGWSVLTYAVLFGRSIEYMTQLIENGGDVNILSRERMSLLHYAAIKGDVNVVDYFVEKVHDKNCADSDGNNALHYAFGRISSHYNVAKLLIRKGLSVNGENFKGVKAIDAALNAYERWEHFKSSDIFILMLSHGLNVESTNQFGSTFPFALINVLSHEHCEEVFKYMYYANNTKCFHIPGNNGETLLQKCMQKFEPSAELLNIFKLAGAYFDARDTCLEILYYCMTAAACMLL